MAVADSEVSISGGDPVPLASFGIPLGAGKPVVVGTFAPGFDPTRDLFKYRLDDANNFSPDYYFKMVGTGDFRPIGETTTTGSGQFSGLFLAPDMQGSRLWLVVWDSNKADGNSTLVTSFSRNNWIVGPAGSSQQIDLSEADFAIFGEMVNGQLRMGILPMPEPGPIALTAVGVGFALFFRPSRRRDKDGGPRDSDALA